MKPFLLFGTWNGIRVRWEDTPTLDDEQATFARKVAEQLKIPSAKCKKGAPAYVMWANEADFAGAVADVESPDEFRAKIEAEFNVRDGQVVSSEQLARSISFGMEDYKYQANLKFVKMQEDLVAIGGIWATDRAVYNRVVGGWQPQS